MIQAARTPAPRIGRLTVGSVAVATLLCTALAARVIYVLGTWSYHPIFDARSYSWLAHGLADGRGWVMGPSAYRPPGYPFFLALVYRITGIPHTVAGHVAGHLGGWTPARLFEALLATATVALIGVLTRQLAGRREALLAVALSAFYVPLILVGVSLMSESLLVPLMVGASICALRAREGEHRVRWLVLAGVLSGWAALTRGNGIMIGIALAFVVWTGQPRWSWRSLRSPLLLLGAMACVILPWTVRNAITQRAFVPVTTELGNTLAGTYNSLAARHHYLWRPGFAYPDYAAIRRNRSLSEATRDADLTGEVLGYIGRHPLSVPTAMFWNTVRLADLEGRAISRTSARLDLGASSGAADLAVYSFWIVGLLALVGLLSRSVRRMPRSVWLLPFAIWLTEAPLTTGTPRFRAVLDPWLIVLASCGIAAIAHSAGRIRVRRRGRLPAASALR